MPDAQPQYQAIFDNAFEGIAVVDAEGSIISANPAVEQIFGYSQAEILGRNVGILMPEPDSFSPDRYARGRPYGRSSLRAIVGAGREVRGRRKDGSVFPVDLSIAEWEREGETFFTSIMRDISERREAECALADGKLLAKLHSQSGAGLAETDSDGRFIAVNSRYCRIAGRSRKELLSMRLHDIAHPDDHQQNLPLFTKLVTAGGPQSIEERYVRGDGSIAWVIETVSPLRIVDGKQVGLLVAIDVTERRLAETALGESERQLCLLQNDFAHLSRVSDLGEMAAAITHEVNQPLAAILSYLNGGLMRVDNESPGQALAAAREAMALAAEQGARAAKIVRGLNEFVQKGTGVREVRQADILVDSAITLALIDRRGSGIALERRRAEDDVTIEVDPVQIQQVLVNLLRNAVEALRTNPPGVERRLTVSVGDRADLGMVQILVSDTGPGISPDIRERLFQPFVTSKATGMGMGLSVCRRIVQAHGGTIEAMPRESGGATFVVRLPRCEEVKL